MAYAHFWIYLCCLLAVAGAWKVQIQDPGTLPESKRNFEKFRIFFLSLEKLIFTKKHTIKIIFCKLSITYKKSFFIFFIFILMFLTNFHCSFDSFKGFLFYFYFFF